MKIQNLSVTEITPYEKNPRINCDAVEFLMKSIQDFGWRQPIVVDSDYVIIAGHTRLLAAQELGLEEVPVHIATDLSPEKVKALRLADNKTAEKSYWDNGLLQEEMAELAEFDIDMKEFGFETFETKGAFSDSEPDISDSLFDDDLDEEVNMFSAKLQILFDDPEDLSQAQRVFELTPKDKKVPWSRIAEALSNIES